MDLEGGLTVNAATAAVDPINHLEERNSSQARGLLLYLSHAVDSREGLMMICM